MDRAVAMVISDQAMKPPRTGDSAADRKAEQKLADDAIAAWRDALKLAPDDNARQGVHVHLARWQINAGRFDDGRASLNLLTNTAFASTKRALDKKLAKQEALGTNATPAAVERSAKP